LHVRSHMSVTSGQPLLDLVRSGVLLLKLNVPSRWISTMKMGNKFNVTIDETGKTYPAEVRRINSRIDPVSQTIELEATLLQTYRELLPGMSGVAQFTGMP
ncbi:MAG: HlyD family efflux transporter periplasmic adaptor subunit, partial [Hydrogenophaga sp.]